MRRKDDLGFHRAAGLRAENVGELAPDHHRDEFAVIEFGDRKRADQAAVLEHRRRVRDLEHLVKAVRDEDYRDAARLEAADHVEEKHDLGPPRTAVGSSNTTSLACEVRARAISTICWSATDSDLILASGSMRAPISPSIRAAPCRIARRSTIRPHSRLIVGEMFWATVISGKSTSS